MRRFLDWVQNRNSTEAVRLTGGLASYTESDAPPPVVVNILPPIEESASTSIFLSNATENRVAVALPVNTPFVTTDLIGAIAEYIDLKTLVAFAAINKMARQEITEFSTTPQKYHLRYLRAVTSIFLYNFVNNYPDLKASVFYEESAQKFFYMRNCTLYYGPKLISTREWDFVGYVYEDTENDDTGYIDFLLNHPNHPVYRKLEQNFLRPLSSNFTCLKNTFFEKNISRRMIFVTRYLLHFLFMLTAITSVILLRLQNLGPLMLTTNFRSSSQFTVSCLQLLTNTTLLFPPVMVSGAQGGPYQWPAQELIQNVCDQMSYHCSSLLLFITAHAPSNNYEAPDDRTPTNNSECYGIPPAPYANILSLYCKQSGSSAVLPLYFLFLGSVLLCFISISLHLCLNMRNEEEELWIPCNSHLPESVVHFFKHTNEVRKAEAEAIRAQMPARTEEDDPYTMICGI